MRGIHQNPVLHHHRHGWANHRSPPTTIRRGTSSNMRTSAPSLTSPDHGAVHGARRPRHHCAMRCASNQATTRGTNERAASNAASATLWARTACVRDIPLIPLIPLKSHLSRESRLKFCESVPLRRRADTTGDGGQIPSATAREERVSGPRSPRCTGAPPRRGAGSGAGRGPPPAPPSRKPARSRRASAPPHPAHR